MIAFSSSKARVERVVVVGAGAAGAAAARTLADAGIHVVVVEARDRVGGRIHSDRARGVEFGAGWVHDTATRGYAVQRLLRRDGVRTVRTDFYRALIHAPDGTSVPIRRVSRQIERVEAALGTATAGPTESVGNLLDRVTSSLGLDDKAGVEAVHLVRQAAENNMASDARDASAAFYLSHESVRQSDDDRMVVGGYDRLVEGLLGDLEVRLGQAATAVKQSREGVTVETSSGVVRADAAVVTLPLGVLQAQAVAFEPALPALKREAIGRLRMGDFNKVILTFREPFWKRGLRSGEPDVLVFQREARDSFGMAVNLLRYTGAPVLVAMSAGRAARWAEEAGPEAVRAEWEAVLDRAYPGASGLLERVETTAWSGDPYAGGAYSVVPPGVDGPAAQAAMAALHGRVAFAGEALAGADQGTVHGAYDSGVRAAGMVLALDLGDPGPAPDA